MVPSLQQERDVMKKLQPKPVVDRDFVSRDLHRIDASDLLRPAVLLAITELPEHRHALYLARLEEMLARPDERAKAA